VQKAEGALKHTSMSQTLHVHKVVVVCTCVVARARMWLHVCVVVLVAIVMFVVAHAHVFCASCSHHCGACCVVFYMHANMFSMHVLAVGYSYTLGASSL